MEVTRAVGTCACASLISWRFWNPQDRSSAGSHLLQGHHESTTEHDRSTHPLDSLPGKPCHQVSLPWSLGMSKSRRKGAQRPVMISSLRCLLDLSLPGLLVCCYINEKNGNGALGLYDFSLSLHNSKPQSEK